MIGASPAFNAMACLIRRIAATDAPALIEGETGTGKELAARAIHSGGPRRSRQFVRLDCTSREARSGLVALAEGGTLFLDDVDALSLRAQVDLLRFLRDPRFRPSGGRSERRADVRVVAATKASLLDLVRIDRFREDLYLQLQTLRLSLPPLRARSGDPILLAIHFAARLSARYHRASPRIDAAAARWLDEQAWPGNIRELENIVHRAVLLSAGPVLDLSQAHPSAPSITPAGRGRAITGFREAKAEAIELFERRFVLQALNDSAGNVSLAARRCGKERRAFGRLLRKHGIDRGAAVPST